MKGIFNNPDEDFDVQERAGFYYSLLKNDLDTLTKIFEQVRYSQAGVVDVASKAAVLEFNTLSIIYNSPADVFTKPYDYFKNQRLKEDNKAEEVKPDGEIEKEEEVVQEEADLLDQIKNTDSTEQANQEDGDEEQTPQIMGIQFLNY